MSTILSIIVSFPFALGLSYFLFSLIKLVSRKTANRLAQPRRQRWTFLYIIALAYVFQAIAVSSCAHALHATWMTAVSYSSVVWATYPLIFVFSDPSGMSLCILIAIVTSSIFQFTTPSRLNLKVST